MLLFEKAKEFGVSLSELIDQIRRHAIDKYVSADVKNLCQKYGIWLPQKTTLRQDHWVVKQAEHWWFDWHWHLKNRLRGDKHYKEFISLFPEYDIPGMEEYLKAEYDLSILPLYFSQGLSRAVKYVLPEVGYISRVDPYAIKHKNAAITTTTNKGKFYVATRKERYGTYLLTLTVPWSEDPTKGTFLCPIGCRPCYRGWETRHKRNLQITETSEELIASKIRQQTESLVKHWSPEVYDVLVSGGEPLLFSNKIIREDVIGVLKRSPYLRSFRICTGALSLGLFARFDDDLIKALIELRREAGVQVAINAHLTHPENFTPEMIEAALKLKYQNIRLMPQVPLVEGVNFWNYDLPRTISHLRRLARLSTLLLNEPIYKFIVDMQGSVSLLQAIRVYRSLFDRHQRESNIVRPIAFELFVESAVGNVNLSYHTLYSIKMKVDKKNQVRYEIPHPAGGEVIWEEKLMKGVNDSLALLKRAKKEKPIES